MSRKEESKGLDQQDSNSKGVEIEAVKNKDILIRVKEVLGK